LSEGDTSPLILTLGFEAAGFERLNGLRQAHFPEHLNHIPAHLTLFHHLPGDDLAGVSASVARAAGGNAPFAVTFPGLRSLGQGVALQVEAQPLTTLRGRIAADFADRLTAQDRQGFRPHVTIQNKVDPSVAAALHDRLTESFAPWTVVAEALLLWRYRGGPWEAAGRFAFSSGA
jgi:2'-5' RNA ligase